MIFFQERAIEGQPVDVRTELAEEPVTNGEKDFGVNLIE